MKIKVFQINQELDKNRVKFFEQQPEDVNPAIYDEVFSGEVSCKELEEVFTLFNKNPPPFHRGHSMSISDVVQVDGYSPEFVGIVRYHLSSSFSEDMVFTNKEKFEKESKITVEDYGVPTNSRIIRNLEAPEVENGFYLCNTNGFVKIEFDSAQTHKLDNLLRVVALEPGRAAYEAEIVDHFHAFQQAVSGHFEVAYPFDDDAVLVCNEEGLIKDMEPNRMINDNIYVGPLFIVRNGGDGELYSLTDEQVSKYLSEFETPEFYPHFNNEFDYDISMF